MFCIATMLMEKKTEIFKGAVIGCLKSESLKVYVPGGGRFFDNVVCVRMCILML